MVRLKVPTVESAPALRESLSELADFVILMDGETEADLLPQEGSPIVRDYFTTHRLGDASTHWNPTAWQPLLTCNPYTNDNPARREVLLAAADKLAQHGEGRRSFKGNPRTGCGARGRRNRRVLRRSTPISFRGLPSRVSLAYKN